MANPDLAIASDLPSTIRDDAAGTIPNTSPTSDDGSDYCRICRGEASPEQPLFHPCKCSGSIRYVHQDCLMEWLSHSKKKYCELCKTSFRFTKLYDSSMPATLPLPLFARQLFLHVVRTLSMWARYTLVGVVWLVCLPWCIRQVWRGLFWLADGSWVSETELRRANLQRLNATLASLTQLNSSLTEHGLSALNQTYLQSVLEETQAVQESIQRPFTPLIRFMRLLSVEGLVTSLFNLFAARLDFISEAFSLKTNLTSTTQQTSSRAPSLLSDFNLVRPVSSSAVLNDAAVDVLEGMCICFGLVLGFILIFLIREWVINQQPMLNIPDHDAQENQPAPAAGQQLEGRPHLRPRRRRILPRGVEPLALPVPGRPAHAVRPGPPMQPRRALTDDNIAVPEATDAERPAMPVRSQSLVPESIWTSEDSSESPAAQDGLPAPPLIRGAIGDAVTVHRTIEEGPSEADDAKEQPLPVAAFSEDIHASPILDHNDFGPDDQSAQQNSDLANQLDIEHDLSSRPEQSHELHISEHPQTEDVELHTFTDSDSEIIETPESSPDRSQQQNMADTEQTTPDSVPTTVQTSTANEQPPNESLWDRTARWLWHVDGIDVTPAPANDRDHEQLVHDIQAEAPFVPVQNGAAVVARPQQALPEAQHLDDAGPVQLGNVAGPLDPNDPNAVEDAEDLEGILELVGMEGPIVGMLQNVIFSLFLITITLIASIWIPYIWGKIALLLLANPVAVLVKAPIFFVSNIADLVADVCFFVLGLFGLLFNYVTKVAQSFVQPISPRVSNLVDTAKFDQLAANVTHRSGKRLEDTIFSTLMTLSPDLPTFSLQSHRALISLKDSVSVIQTYLVNTATELSALAQPSAWSLSATRQVVWTAKRQASELPGQLQLALSNLWQNTTVILSPSIRSANTQKTFPSEPVVVEWTTQEKFIAIVLGYLFFALLGFAFLRLARLFLGLKDDEKVEGPLADSLRQAGGVMKVIVIIGIEMMVFPLYCGLLLDAALLPLFEGATWRTRLAFIAHAPFTGLFLHWFIGTCYMFHFALFVSMCRKILRKGVLYFIRDPDDPTFHPVRDVLERPVPTQLGKIAFSALVYGGLVIMCLGGVVWGIGRFDGVLPIRWSTAQPRLAFPIDVLFFNFMLPFILRKAEPSKRISAVYEWWFRGCAHGLRLTNFLFGEEKEEEKYSETRSLPWRQSSTSVKDGIYVRAPAADSCRIPKDRKVFLEVNENNERIDGQPDLDEGLHGCKNDNFVMVYLPPQFRARVATFIVLLWLFAASTGVAATIGPLVVGRKAVKFVSGVDVPVNDLYALTVGFHILGGLFYSLANIHRAVRWILDVVQRQFSISSQTVARSYHGCKYGLGLLYLGLSFGLVLPFALSLLTELYLHVPLITFLVPGSSKVKITSLSTQDKTPRLLTPTVFILQTWTLGLLYLRLVLRIAATYPHGDTRLAIAVRSIVRAGYLNPDVKLASRAVILPLISACFVLLGFPLGSAQIAIKLLRIEDTAQQIQIFRYAYPGLLGAAMAVNALLVLKRRLDDWRLKIRDEVYLVGERLHNFVEEKRFTVVVEGKEKVA